MTLFVLLHLGSVELAAVGVSIALFNQASRIAIFPLVSVTTSFVAEEDTIGRVSPEAEESDDLEACSTKVENKLLIPQKGMTICVNWIKSRPLHFLL